MPSGPADQNLVRQLNSALILDHLLVNAPQSRANLAQQTGLNRSTISSLVSDLIVRGLIREMGLEAADSRGRPGMLLELNPGGGCIVGIEINFGYVSIILTDFTARILWQRLVEVDPGTPQAAVLTLAGELIEAAQQVGQAHALPPLGIGLGVPGLVDTQSGTLRYAPILNWHDVSFREVWGQRFGVPVIIENDGNASALSEHYFGVAKGNNNFIYLSTGIGLSGGLMLNGQLYRGAGGYAGEVGHIIVESGGELCSCGRRGCWETLVGPRAVLRGVTHALNNGAPSLIPKLIGHDLSKLDMKVVVQAANQGDQLALHTLADVALHLGTGIANLINLFNPELVVLGGSLAVAGDYLLPTISNIITSEALSAPTQMVALALSAQGTYACVKGAVALVVDGIVREPISC
ncbi:MAG: ROK family transcriptional regulator [Anaerolineae bacterium]|nr:ROK family transcriptional regulator [Anaerolineae bacterium]